MKDIISLKTPLFLALFGGTLAISNVSTYLITKNVTTVNVMQQCPQATAETEETKEKSPMYSGKKLPTDTGKSF